MVLFHYDIHLQFILWVFMELHKCLVIRKPRIYLRVLKNIFIIFLVSYCIFHQSRIAPIYFLTDTLYFFYLQTASSPRRVAVPVLVKDGKPCAGNNSASQSQQVSAASNAPTNSNNTNVNESNASTEVNNSIASSLSLITGETNNSHSPDTSNSLIASYNGTIVGHNQIQQQSCNNSLMSNSLAMAYRNQNNFISNGHQQQCTGYLPLQGRAW
ncbi:PREDICTED: uncharacterized protein LOC108364100 [Rhagoletis zephyria]|uniref:uncharacterized protein LOC108364100 n=1 Tax=Rhagoletis zephyria TaxID=28612 RepID=UPI0008117580|nr:PREDICTED: uncharacterized protein LOC108364100 [Rhagoletis zephyria]